VRPVIVPVGIGIIVPKCTQVLLIAEHGLIAENK
jgi:hypothetical protein